MVSCSAIGCSNRGEKGFSMKSFPRDPNIRKKWQENVNRLDWEPTEHSKLCEVHFSSEMWEKPRVDGKKKLKWNAVPTIFPNTTNTKKSKNKTEKMLPIFFVASNLIQSAAGNMTEVPEQKTDPLIPTSSAIITEVKESNIHPNSFVSQSYNILNILPKKIVNTENPTIFHNYAQPPTNELETTTQGIQVNHESLAKLFNTPVSSSDFSESFVSDVNIPTTLNNADLFKKISQYQKSYTQLIAKVDNYKNQIKVLTQRNERLVKIAKKDRHLRLLKYVFNDDQICALERNRFMKWSQSTLINALRLKNYCGKDGYEEILRQKIPLPSIRTLNRIKVTDAVNSMIGTNHCSR